MSASSKHVIALSACAALVPEVALADMPMFFVVAFIRFVYWWTIPAAIVVECVAIRFIFGVSWNQALVLSLAANPLSAAAGVLVYPFVGFSLYPALAPGVTAVFGYGLVVEASATMLAMAVVDTLIELGLIALMLRLATPREGALFFGANLVTAALLLAALVHANAPPRLSDAELAAFLSDYAAELALVSEVLEEAPDHLGGSEFGFDEDWLAEKRELAQGLSFDVLRVGSKSRMGHVVSSHQMGMYGATLEGQARSGAFAIKRLARDPRDGGGTFWMVVAALERDETLFSVNAQIE